MSLLFPISSAGKRGGGLGTEGLLEWWDDADIIGKHNSISLGATPGTTITGPNGWNAWNLNGTDCVAGVTGAGYPTGAYAERTAAFVLYRNGDSHQINANSLLAGFTNRLNDYHHLGSRYGQNFELRHKGSRNIFGGFNSNAWMSIVWVETIGGQSQLYKNGTLIFQSAPSASDSRSVGPWQSYLASSQIDVAVACLADRSWTQNDVTAFHNEGNFIQYADL